MQEYKLDGMDNFKASTRKLRPLFCQFALFVVLATELWGQSQTQSAADQTARSAQPETTISSKEAKELFRSVDEILKFASDDTGLPVKHEVKRKLTKRDEVQSYVEKNMREDKDAKRLERSTEVLKKFGLLP